MSKLRRMLRIAYYNTGGSYPKVHMKIIRQTQRNDNFTETGNRFRGTNCMLMSSGSPARRTDTQMYVRGSNPARDWNRVTITPTIFASYIQGIIEYNEKYSNNKGLELEDIAHEAKTLEEFNEYGPIPNYN